MSYCPTHEALAEALAARGYDDADARSRPRSSSRRPHGRDLIVSAQTGSGKTVASASRSPPHLLEGDRAPCACRAPLALVIAPTRELALQVSRELTGSTPRPGARIATCVGGMDPPKERRALARRRPYRRRHAGPPARPSRARRARPVGACASPCSTRPTRCSTWASARISRTSSTRRPHERRTLLFSATMPRPIVALAKRYQKDALRIATVGDERRPRRHRLPGGHGLPDRDRACRGQPAALPRSRDGDPVLRDPRQRPPPPRQPARARLRRRRAVRRA